VTLHPNEDEKQAQEFGVALFAPLLLVRLRSVLHKLGLGPFIILSFYSVKGDEYPLSFLEPNVESGSS